MAYISFILENDGLLKNAVKSALVKLKKNTANLYQKCLQGNLPI